MMFDRITAPLVGRGAITRCDPQACTYHHGLNRDDGARSRADDAET